MKIGWGWKIAVLYGGFVVLILGLVVASSRQHIDLVSKDYYNAELEYQKVIDAGKNQAGLSAPFYVHANGTTVTIDFPGEFKNKNLSGNIEFYAPVNAEWDRSFKIVTQNNSVTIPRDTLHDTRYTVKINCIMDGKSYYQEADIILHS
jgi:hypothetical protein